MREKIMGWSLWLDDDAGKEDMPDRNPPVEVFKRDWKIATTSKQAMRLVVAFGPPEHMDLDHDLGQPEDRMGNDETMYFLKWLHHSYPNSILNITWNTHSRNPDRNKTMHSYLDSWKRSLDLA